MRTSNKNFPGMDNFPRCMNPAQVIRNFFAAGFLIGIPFAALSESNAAYSYPSCPSVRDAANLPCVIKNPEVIAFPDIPLEAAVVRKTAEDVVSIIYFGPADSVTSYFEPGQPLVQISPGKWVLQLAVRDIDKSKFKISLNVKNQGGERRHSLEYTGDLYKELSYPRNGRIEQITVDGGADSLVRNIQIWFPKGVNPQEIRHVVYIADGGVGYGYLLSEDVSSKRLPPVAVVGIPNCDQADPSRDMRCRYQEYVPASEAQRGDPKVFDRHFRYFSEHVVPVIERKVLGLEQEPQRLIAGYSNGADWAFATAAKMPGKFSTALLLSPPMSGLLSVVPDGPTRFDIAVGMYEPSVLMSARRLRDRLERSSISVQYYELPFSHGNDVNRRGFIAGVTRWLRKEY